MPVNAEQAVSGALAPGGRDRRVQPRVQHRAIACAVGDDGADPIPIVGDLPAAAKRSGSIEIADGFIQGLVIVRIALSQTAEIARINGLLVISCLRITM